MNADMLVRTARREAGLTQAQLAARMGVQQPTVARLERAGADPRFSTLQRALRAAGRRVSMTATSPATVDDAQLAANLRLTPAQRLLAFERNYRSLQALAGRAERVG